MSGPAFGGGQPLRAPRRFRPEALAASAFAAAVFALALLSPVEHVDSDPAMALLVSQALLDRHTLRLDDYRDDPACAYPIEPRHNYRLFRYHGSVFYYSPSVSVLSLPIVWLANRLGVHMLDQEAEFALQNLISAACCALIAVVLLRLCRVYLGAVASLAVASISVLGSPLVSTLATGLWNSVYEVLFLALALLGLVRRQAGEPAGVGPAGLAGLAVLAFLCRPVAGFAILGGLAATVRPAMLRRKSTLALAAAAALLVLVFVYPGVGGTPYFSLWKLMPRGSVPTGLWGLLASPSRGLLVFCPFLLPVIAGALGCLPRLAGDRLFRLAIAWSAFQLLAMAGKAMWWGGYCFGPRLLVELMLPAVLVSCLVWRQLERSAGRVRRLAAGAYLVLGLGAVFIHSYQGLFNQATDRWNWTPDVDDHPERIFDWRQPQFLASERSIEQRLFDLERRGLGVYAPGEEIPHDGAGALFRGWYPPEGGWRWNRGASSEVWLRLGALPRRGLYLLRLRAGALGRQEVALEVNGAAAGRVELDGHAPRERAFAFAGALLRPEAENRLRFAVPGAAAPPGDPRVLGLALYSFALHPLPEGFAGVDFADEPFFVRGFSGAESGWRWTDGPRAAIDYPLGDGAEPSILELKARALDPQTVGVRLNGVDVGELDVPGGFGLPVTRRLAFDPGLLLPSRMNRIELTIPRARATPGDARLLGLAFVRLELVDEGRSLRGEPR